MDEGRFEQWWRSLTRSQQIVAGELWAGEVMPTWMVPGVIRYFGPVTASPAFVAGRAGFAFPAEVRDLIHPPRGRPEPPNSLTVEGSRVSTAFDRELSRALERVGERYQEVVILVATAADRDAAIERLMAFVGTRDEQVARGVLGLRLEDLTFSSRAARRERGGNI